MEEDLGFKNKFNIFLILIIIFLLILQFIAVFDFNLHGDEREHLHVAFLISQGELPYLNFFAMHLPFFNLLLSLLMFLPPISVIFIARIFGFFCTLAILFLTYKITFKYSKNKTTSLFATFLVISFRQFFISSFKIRPDNFSSVLLLLSFLLILNLEDIKNLKKLIIFNFIISFLLSVSVFFQLKAVFFIFPMVLILFFRKKIKFIPFILGGLIPVFFIMAIFDFSVHNFKMIYLLNIVFNLNFIGISHKTVLYNIFTYFLINFFFIFLFFIAVIDLNHIKKYTSIAILSLCSLFFYAFFALKGFIGPQYFPFFIPYLAIFSSLKTTQFFFNKKIRTLMLIFLIVIGLLIPVAEFSFEFYRHNLNKDIKEIQFFLDNNGYSSVSLDKGWLIFHKDPHYMWILGELAYVLVEKGVISDFNISELIKEKPLFIKNFFELNQKDKEFIQENYIQTDFSELYLLTNS